MRLAQKHRHHALEQLTQNRARDVAFRQLTRVSWDTFARAYREYPKWQGLVLWTRAVCREEPQPPRIVYETLLQKCPRFLDISSFSKVEEPLDYGLSNWIHSEIFADAKRGGWLDALFFFGNRNTLASRAWDYAEVCENDWRGNRSVHDPDFEMWWKAVEDGVLYPNVTVTKVADTVESYVEWRAFATWLHPFLLNGVELPNHVREELQERCPAFLKSEFRNESPRPSIGKWLRLTEHIVANNFCDVQRGGWFESLRRRAAVHPRDVRTAWFSEHGSSYSSIPTLSRYPSFLEWRTAADSFVRTPLTH